jgi:hypothetical protein
VVLIFIVNRPEDSTEAYAFIGGYVVTRNADRKLGPCSGPLFFRREVLKHWKQPHQGIRHSVLMHPVVLVKLSRANVPSTQQVL